ncbi:putative necrosis-inducing factor-domain-containing protein [Leptodontidium sp. 2 PMI_412]|nr:putative necrosis-inducing factor-domain-containing protein [Leptodontidium sp. 2 PMI_412]
MVSSKILGLSALALLPMSFAAPAPAPAPQTISAATAAIDWTPVDFNGQTIYINSAAMVGSSINPAKKAARDLAKRFVPDNDNCGPSSIDSHPAPFANTADCAAIRDWAGTQNTYWEIWDNTRDTHGVLYLGTCVFEAGTWNNVVTWIGSTDVRDLTRDAINKWQSGGVMAAQGQMGCDNADSPVGESSTRWTIKHS